MNIRHLVSILAAALTAASLVGAAVAAPAANTPLTGIWSGKTHQDLPPLGPDADFVEWTQLIVVKAYKGHLSSVNANVRYTCPDPENPLAGDIRLWVSWDVLKNNGPLLKNGGFAVTVTHVKDPLTGRDVRLPMPVHISGKLGVGGGSGRFDLSQGNCSGKGTWQARRTSTI
jgi:hypothetical protein